MEHLQRLRRPILAPAVNDAGHIPPVAPLWGTLWRRRRTVVVTVVVCLAAAAVYLRFATRVYRASAAVHVVQDGPRVLSDSPGSRASDEFLGTQAMILRSRPVLSRALQSLPLAGSATLANVDGDPVSWLQDGRLRVEVAGKSDVITVSVQVPDAHDAAQITNAVVAGYVAEVAERRRAAGRATVDVLQREREALQGKREVAMREVAQVQRDRGVLSFRTNDDGNMVLQRTASLSQALTAAELATVELRAQERSLRVATADPASMASFVDSIQFRQRDSGDREYDELRTQLIQQHLNLSATATRLGDNHPDVRTLDGRADLLRKRIASKQRSMIDAQIVTTTTQLAAAEERERQLRALLDAQQARASEMSPDALRVAALEANVAQMQKQCEVLDARIAEVGANSLGGGPTNVEVIDWARAPGAPAQPRVGLTLIATLAASWVFGIGLVLLREWQDTRIRTAAEIGALLGTPVVAEIPTVNRRLPPAVRGRVVWSDSRSRAAEAYRAARTAVELAAVRDTRTVLVASPTPGDGKSTTASNLAIAFANAGHRTLLVDCDLVRPVQHLIFNTDQQCGLSAVVAGEGKLVDAIWPTVVPDLHVLSAGPTPSSPSDLLSGKRFALLMETLRGGFDRIVIDSAPLSLSCDAYLLAAAADATLLVVRVNHSKRDAATAALDELRRVGANLVGIVANDVPAPAGAYRQTYTGLTASAAFADHQQVVLRHRRKAAGQQQAVAPAMPEPDWQDVR